MGMAEISIELKALATTATVRSERGIVCLVLDDPGVGGVHTYTKLKNVTDAYSTANKAIITRCFSSRGVNTLKVACYNSTSTTSAVVGQAIVGQAIVGAETVGVNETVTTALTALNGVKFNYIADPYASSADNILIASFVKAQREANNILVKAVLNNYVGDYEGDINFINNTITMTDGTIYTGVEFCVDVACVASTCSLKSSLTNMAIDGIASVDVVGTDFDSLVDAGKLFLFYDNDLEEVVFSRAVNSKTTIGTDEKASMKKIRVMDILDMVRNDMKVTFKSSYQGKVGNSLADKKLLVTAYNTYLRGLVTEGALSDSQTSYVELDVDATTTYLEDTKGMDCSAMTDAEILAEPTDEKVFIIGTVYPIDVMEDLALVLNF